jgi:hypothetical protein
MRTAPPPSIVILPPPSMTVSLPVGSSIVLVTVMVAGAAPQSNVTTPPAVSADESSASVHDEAVPVPTTVVGWLESAAPMGAVHTALGGGTLPASTLGGGSPTASATIPLSDPGFVASSPPSAPPGELPDEPDEPQPTAHTSAATGSVRRLRMPLETIAARGGFVTSTA